MIEDLSMKVYYYSFYPLALNGTLEFPSKKIKAHEQNIKNKVFLSAVGFMKEPVAKEPVY